MLALEGRGEGLKGERLEVAKEGEVVVMERGAREIVIGERVNKEEGGGDQSRREMIG